MRFIYRFTFANPEAHTRLSPAQHTIEGIGKDPIEAFDNALTEADLTVTGMQADVDYERLAPVIQ